MVKCIRLSYYTLETNYFTALEGIFLKRREYIYLTGLQGYRWGDTNRLLVTDRNLVPIDLVLMKEDCRNLSCRVVVGELMQLIDLESLMMQGCSIFAGHIQGMRYCIERRIL